MQVMFKFWFLRLGVNLLLGLTTTAYYLDLLATSQFSWFNFVWLAICAGATAATLLQAKVAFTGSFCLETLSVRTIWMSCFKCYNKFVVLQNCLQMKFTHPS